MHFRLVVPLGFASLALAVSNPSSQKVTSSAAFSSGAGNNNNANIFDGTGNAGSDTYSNFSPATQSFNTFSLSNAGTLILHRMLSWRLAKLPSSFPMDRVRCHVELLEKCHGGIVFRLGNWILRKPRRCFWIWQQRRADWLNLECHPASCPDFFG